MSFTVCAYFTEKTPYENLAKEFEENCKQFGVETFIKGYESRHSWVRNCGIKPEFIAHCFKHLTTDIVYIDVDGRIRKYPELFDRINADMAAHLYRGQELLSGTLFFKNNTTSGRMVHDWVTRQKARPDDFDQHNLHFVVRDWGTSLKFLDLPPEYTKIFDYPMGDPVIEHFQASRKFKGEIR